MNGDGRRVSAVPVDHSVDDVELDAPVLRASFLGVVARDRPRLAESLRLEAARADAEAVQTLDDGVGAAFRQALVVLIGAARIGVPVDRDRDLGLLAQDAR